MKANSRSLGIDRRAWIKKVGISSLGLALGGRAWGQAEPRVSVPKQIERYPELKYINLAGNENPFGPSPKVSMALMKEIRNSSRYPFREEEILKERIAQREGVLKENILLGNGCDEILSLTGAEFGKPGATMVATRPTYLQLMDYAEKRGAHVEWVDHDREMRHDLGAMMAALEEKEGKLAYICNPDTPTGTILEPAKIERFCKEASERATVFVDEVYLDLLDDFETQTQVDLVRQGYPVIIGRSFSKMHGLAGHRIGYAIAAPEMVEALGRHKMSSPSYLGVIAALASLEDDDFHQQSRRFIADGRKQYCQLLDELGLAYTPSVGNFVFHHTGIEIRAFQAEMKKRGFLVGRPFPPYEDWCRVSIGTRKEMSLYEEAMRAVFAA